MVKDFKIDEEAYYNEAMSIMSEFNSYLDSTTKHFNNAVLTFIWFIIATSWIIVTNVNTSICTKYLLVLSIIFLSLWLLLSFIASWKQLQWYNEFWVWVLNWHKSKTEEEFISKMNWYTKKLYPSKIMIILSESAWWLELLWMILFIIGLIVYFFTFNS